MFESLRGQHVLVTGGCGYIGSHTVLELLSVGARVTVVDSLVNSHRACYERVRELAGLGPDPSSSSSSSSSSSPTASPLCFIQADLRDKAALLADVFLPAQRRNDIFTACIHFAGLKAVGESVSQPLRYYEFNVFGALNLLECLEQFSCRNLVFSSSATVYGLVEKNPITEDFQLGSTNPYGSTKLHIEKMLTEVAGAPGSEWRIAILRYFNPIGAHASGRIGEDPAGIPNNLLPYVLQVAVGRRDHVVVHGNDWPTADGTGVRDFIHVVDLAKGHLAALGNAIFAPEKMVSRCEAYNLGTGRGNSVLEIIRATEKACGHPIPFVMGPRRGGDIAACYSEPGKAKRELGWVAEKTLEEAVADSWRWQKMNPLGFLGAPESMQRNGQ